MPTRRTARGDDQLPDQVVKGAACVVYAIANLDTPVSGQWRQLADSDRVCPDTVNRNRFTTSRKPPHIRFDFGIQRIEVLLGPVKFQVDARRIQVAPPRQSR